MYARINTFNGSAERFEQAIAYVRERVIPAASMIPGFAGMISLIDRESGRSLGITLWENLDALQMSEEAAAGVRGQATQSDEATVIRVERYEVADFFLTPKEI